MGGAGALCCLMLNAESREVTYRYHDTASGYRTVQIRHQATEHQRYAMIRHQATTTVYHALDYITAVQLWRKILSSSKRISSLNVPNILQCRMHRRITERTRNLHEIPSTQDDSLPRLPGGNLLALGNVTGIVLHCTLQIQFLHNMASIAYLFIFNGQISFYYYLFSFTCIFCGIFRFWSVCLGYHRYMEDLSTSERHEGTSPRLWETMKWTFLLCSNFSSEFLW